MGRMTKYLRQQCSLQHVKVSEDGTPVMNTYGEYEYEEPVLVRCRVEPYHRITAATGGRFVNTSSRYFFDESVEIRPEDLLDGHVVLQVSQYCGSSGRVEGYEVYV